MRSLTGFTQGAFDGDPRQGGAAQAQLGTTGLGTRERRGTREKACTYKHWAGRDGKWESDGQVT